MRSKVVTVFGGSGFLGRYVVQRLAELGATLRVPTRHPDQAIHLKPLGAVGQIVLERWSAGVPSELERMLAGSQAAVNLIGLLHEPRRGDFARLQGQMPGLLGEAATRLGLERVVQISAIGADAGSPSAYAASKAQGEAALRAAFPRATILRPSLVVGPEDGFFNRFARMAEVSPVLPLIGGGQTRFQPVYVGDVADAVVAALTRAEAPGRTYELGGPTVYSFRDLIGYLLKVTGRRRLLVSLPFGLARLQGRLLQHLPMPPLTEDQVVLLERDNVLTPGVPGLAELGIQPTPLEVVVPPYLRAYGRPSLHLPVA
ncbi:MAG: complex I NDUFA9 subunit family protein [Geminicoccaceae bacterium]